jgi:hypothetical protein
MPERRLQAQPVVGPLHSPWNTEQPTHRATHRANNNRRLDTRLHASFRIVVPSLHVPGMAWVLQQGPSELLLSG